MTGPDDGQGTTDGNSLSLRALWESMHREIDAANGLEDDELTRRCGVINEMRDRLADWPARTLGDVAVKLRELEYVIKEWDLDTHWHEPLLRSASEGLERLVGEMPTGRPS